ncbi:MAG: sterol desaturase [Crocinitomicaceae bacterium]|nr:sterol desaturase [Crocinitomicaceae bacterium]|tara:strand:+ start:1441 stop:2316 length:876 start_codon:yes stop_codon:yes gene_type:complete
MGEYIKAFFAELTGCGNWVWSTITFQVPWYTNYFWGIFLISLIIWGLEILFPWRKNQSIIRKDFWMDAFYMYFNFFIFSIMIAGLYNVNLLLFKNMGFTMESFTIIDIKAWPMGLQLLVFFIVLDFVQWFTHVLLHRYEILWKFHKVHHSVEQMGFAAHLRYHWMENLLYKPLKTLGVMVLGGFEPEQAYVVHFFAITIGHLNHANLKLPWGPLRYVFNNSEMHIWHHVWQLPEGKGRGINFGISLSLWDYLFGTAVIPSDGRDIKLGFPNLEKFPKTFFGQLIYGFKKGD